MLFDCIPNNGRTTQNYFSVVLLRIDTCVFRWMDGEKAPGGTVARLPSVHEQEDGTILAVCATGSSSRDSLLSWIRRLEVSHACLSFIFVHPLSPGGGSSLCHLILLLWVSMLEVEEYVCLQFFSSLIEKCYPPFLNFSTPPLCEQYFHQVSNPRLEDMVVLFTLTSPLGPVIPVQETSSMSRH